MDARDASDEAEIGRLLTELVRSHWTVQVEEECLGPRRITVYIVGHGTEHTYHAPRLVAALRRAHAGEPGEEG